MVAHIQKSVNEKAEVEKLVKDQDIVYLRTRRDYPKETLDFLMQVLEKMDFN